MERIQLNEARIEVDKKYVGFQPNCGTVKPVHIASGSQRCIYGAFNHSKTVKRMALVSDTKGRIPKGNEAETIYKYLSENEAIEETISINSIESMRNTMQHLLDADKGAYAISTLADSMIAFSAGAKYFLTSGVGAPYEKGGEFIGSIIKGYCPELADYIKELLEKANDPITLLFEPILEADMQVFTNQSQYEDIVAFQKPNESMNWFLDGIKEGGKCLLDNLKKHPNPFTQLRIFNFFCIFNLIRYTTSLEAFYCNEKIRPILLDFSEKRPRLSSVARMSEVSYTQMYKSISRFYAWGYAKWLEDEGYTKNELLKMDTPIYAKGKEGSKSNKDEIDTLWSYAKEQVKDMSNEDAFLFFGETMYGILASEASSNPVNYIKALGTSTGLLYPPDPFHPNKRFVVSQDILEMLLRSCVTSEEVISSMEIRERLWNRFGIIIGGSQFEIQLLQKSGTMPQTDEDALEENFTSFAMTLESMDFAEVMADGILQIRMGGDSK